jgi:hypothetical protein
MGDGPAVAGSGDRPNLPNSQTATYTNDAPPPPTTCRFMDGWLYQPPEP